MRLKLGRKHYQCLTNQSPSSGNKRCMQFEKDKGVEAMPKSGNSLKIVYNRGKRSTVCYR